MSTFKNKIRDWDGSGCNSNIYNRCSGFVCSGWLGEGAPGWSDVRRAGGVSRTVVFLGSQWAGLDFWRVVLM